MTSNSTHHLVPLPKNDEVLIPARQLPAYVGLSAQTLARWRHEGKGPEYLKIGRTIAYSAGEIRQWLEKRRRASTSQNSDADRHVQC